MIDPEKMGTLEEMMTPKEAGNYLRVNPSTLTTWVNQGRLRCIKLPSGHRRFPLSAIRAIAEGRYDDAKPGRGPDPDDNRDMVTLLI